ncbi:MAG: glutamate cyclase domain-containing protein [Ottowia sp.]|uniref:glutamate cyclase domain-containing protein n=1 Tax=Ottowia sp. TaxID=1898956 RepID=UPI003C737BF9
MKRASLPADFFASIDHLVNIEFKAKRALLGGTRFRFEAALAAAGEPMTLKAARLLADLPPGSGVFVTTGAGNPITLPKGETDGPSGAAILARALHSRGHHIVVASDPAFLPGVVASFDAVGLTTDANGHGDRMRVQEWPLGRAAGQRATELLLARYPDLSAGIFIEKPGPNSRGVFHTSSGKAKDSESVAHLHVLAEALAASKRMTIGVGDGGNEVGFGCVGRALETTLALARDCGCGCGAGVVNDTRVDALVSASTSNWGAYGIAVALAMLTQAKDLLPPMEAIRSTVEASMHAGANDGYSGENVSTVDGTSLEASEAVYGLCLEVLRQAEALE